MNLKCPFLAKNVEESIISQLVSIQCNTIDTMDIESNHNINVINNENIIETVFLWAFGLQS